MRRNLPSSNKGMGYHLVHPKASLPKMVGLALGKSNDRMDVCIIYVNYNRMLLRNYVCNGTVITLASHCESCYLNLGDGDPITSYLPLFAPRVV